MVSIPEYLYLTSCALIEKKVFSLIRDYDFREHFSPTAGLLNDTLIPTTSNYTILQI